MIGGGDVITIIAHIKTDIDAVVLETQELFGEGSRVDAVRMEEHFALGNTPLEEAHMRIVVLPHIAMALDYLQSVYTSPNVDLVKIEWDGCEDYTLPSGQLLGVIV
jgi:hypothetical protein